MSDKVLNLGSSGEEIQGQMPILDNRMNSKIDFDPRQMLDDERLLFFHARRGER